MGYQLFLKNSLYLDQLLDDAKSLVKMIRSEAIKLSKQEINLGKHSADISARSMALVIVHWRHFWLQNIALSIETRARVEDLPFEQYTLFAKTTNDFSANIKWNWQAARSLSMYPSVSFQGQWFGQYQHGCSLIPIAHPKVWSYWNAKGAWDLTLPNIISQRNKGNDRKTSEWPAQWLEA